MRFFPGLPLLLFSTGSVARNIVFPPIHEVTGQASLSNDGVADDIDIVTGSQFSGLSTFAHVPYVNCFIDGEAEKEKYDIAILGAPFDTAVTARPGARYGPGGIRRGSARMRAGSAWSVYSGQLDKAHKVVSSRIANTTDVSSVPRIITLGGDHTTTLSALRSTYEKWGPVSVVHFDSHIDTWDPEVLGGGVSSYAGVNHGTFLHIAHEEGLVQNNSIHVGIRAPLVREKGDLRNDVRCGFDIVTARDIDMIGASGIIEKIKNRVGSDNVYISVDIDVLDPAFAPATGTAEPGGFSTRELLTILDGLSGLRVIGGDVVEVAPVYDTTGETTVLAAAEVANSLLGLMIAKPVPNERK
ncbi:agmatinase [Coccidioides immitis RS]|uniref:Agmatinase n=2 Tax=Coccidioides TaxID=5500 RepID=A0A0D8JSN5_COCIM|nr:agmatinase [Coccidioides immitis RS]EFW18217.1 arginase [Coccidioides posadasii str. Silveira]KJF60360.1 agmatinase [Coccidioides immitis RS]